MENSNVEKRSMENSDMESSNRRMKSGFLGGKDIGGF